MVNSHLSTNHRLLHLEEELSRLKLRNFKLELRGNRTQRLISHLEDWDAHLSQGWVPKGVYRYYYLAKYLKRFWEGIRQQYGYAWRDEFNVFKPS